MPTATATTASPIATPAQTAAFIARWQGVTASELSTAQSFVIDLCALLGVDKPHPTPEQSYMFERPITFQHGDGSTSAGRIDCYKRGHFVLEAKKLHAPSHTKGFDNGLLRARSQAEGYARALPAGEGRPPFLLVVDVGNVIEVYAEFTRSGATYTPFPDPRSHRLALADLAQPQVLARLHGIFTAPDTLDPARISAQVTRDVAALLAELAKSLEESLRAEYAQNTPLAPASKAPAASEKVAAYLTRCLFCMFAEDVGLLPPESFTNLLERYREQPATLQQMLRILWADMDKGGFCAALAQPVLHFNGKLFKGAESDGYSLPLTAAQIDLLLQAAHANWREVEPAIFGTLLERALDPTERHALGAHYTPRAYVERLVLPTVIAPLRAEWDNARAAALVLAHEAAQASGKAAQDKLAAARAQVQQFHHRLCSLRVLDPACGSANFLYVTLEHLKRLEGEVLNQLEDLGHSQDSLGFAGETVTLQQLRGIELNDRAAALAELVLWIGWLQWHVRTCGLGSVAQPVVHNWGNIECRDAALAWDAQELARDAAGQPLTRWDGRTTTTHPTTGEAVPDPSAQVPQWHYSGARQADWPQADFIVGNPPFIGNKRMREALGDGYVQALRRAWPQVPESADLVMYWWHHAAQLVAQNKVERVGLITTNSLTMVFNRRVVQAALNAGTHLDMAIADHPWVDSSSGAAVRIAMTVLAAGRGEGLLHQVTEEKEGREGEILVELKTTPGIIHADLTVGANTASLKTLLANKGLACPGVQLSGQGFILSPAEAQAMHAAGSGALVKRYFTGRDLMQSMREQYVIDTFGFDGVSLRDTHPAIYQWLFDRVKPERDLNPRDSYRIQWWRHAETRSKFRSALDGLTKVIVTSRTARHRIFQFTEAASLPETKVLIFALNDAFSLGILQSDLHVTFANHTGGWLGVGNDSTYNHTDCFEKFPFPTPATGLTPALHSQIAELAEKIDTHRKQVLAAHSAAGLTLTGLYNTLAALRAGRPLTAKEKTQHQQGLVAVLRELHDQLDAAVLTAYGLPATADTQQCLQHLVQLNAERAREEAQGHIHWLRPALQNPQKSLQNQELLGQTGQALEGDLTSQKSLLKQEQKTAQAWPKTLPEQIQALAGALTAQPQTLPQLATHFKGRALAKTLPPLLETLTVLGRAHKASLGGEDAWRG